MIVLAEISWKRVSVDTAEKRALTLCVGGTAARGSLSKLLGRKVGLYGECLDQNLLEYCPGFGNWEGSIRVLHGKADVN